MEQGIELHISEVLKKTSEKRKKMGEREGACLWGI